MKKVIPFLFVISIIFISCSEDNVDCGTKVVNDQTVVLELGNLFLKGCQLHLDGISIWPPSEMGLVDIVDLSV